MSTTIELRCPKCGESFQTHRVRTDYPEAVRIEILCPHCVTGDFAELKQYDAAGLHITRDPDDPFKVAP